jgi:hypothetical protein
LHGVLRCLPALAQLVQELLRGPPVHLDVEPHEEFLEEAQHVLAGVGRLHIQVYWGTPQEFLHELRERREAT